MGEPWLNLEVDWGWGACKQGSSCSLRSTDEGWGKVVAVGKEIKENLGSGCPGIQLGGLTGQSQDTGQQKQMEKQV